MFKGSFLPSFFLPQELGSQQKNAVPSAGAEGALGAKMVAERHTVASRRLGVPDLKGDFGMAVSAKACVNT